MKQMNDYEYLKQVGIEFPKDFVFTQNDWKDFYRTLSEFKCHVMRRQGLDPIVTPSGWIRLVVIQEEGAVCRYCGSERGG
ncbi:MAG: hypothetical protein H8D67_21120 [Deltaproteobacteria bacterium]|nr:hypothetical protein [Deltaproteobacteria bacterium]